MANADYTPGTDNSNRPSAKILDTSAIVSIGDAGTGPLAKMILQVSTTGTFSLSLRQRLLGSTVAAVAATTPGLTGYIAATAPGTYVTGATPITAAGRYVVDCAVSELFLDFTQTTGVTTVEYRPSNL